jgi:hypothetical protein
MLHKKNEYYSCGAKRAIRTARNVLFARCEMYYSRGAK